MRPTRGGETHIPDGRGLVTGMTSNHPGLAALTASLVRALVAEQFPQWSDLSVRIVAPGGNDHRTFRLGRDLSVRLPSAPAYVPQVLKEQTWLPRLAPVLPLPIPAVHAVGRACARFPAPWSVYGWLEGNLRPGIGSTTRFDSPSTSLPFSSRSGLSMRPRALARVCTAPSAVVPYGIGMRRCAFSCQGCEEASATGPRACGMTRYRCPSPGRRCGSTGTWR